MKSIFTFQQDVNTFNNFNFIKLLNIIRLCNYVEINFSIINKTTFTYWRK